MITAVGFVFFDKHPFFEGLLRLVKETFGLEPFYDVRLTSLIAFYIKSLDLLQQLGINHISELVLTLISNKSQRDQQVSLFEL